MPSLKHLRNRIGSVKSTRKITSAMKMVAASKLRQSQDRENAGRPYARAMDDLLHRALGAIDEESRKDYPLLAGSGKDDNHLVIVVTSDRGLCGGFNSNLVRAARNEIQSLIKEGKSPKIICIGRKGHDSIRRDFPDLILDVYTDIDKPTLGFEKAYVIAEILLDLYGKGEYDVVSVFYNRFQNVITQIPTQEQVIPITPEKNIHKKAKSEQEKTTEAIQHDHEGTLIFEPPADVLLKHLLPQAVSSHLYKILLNSAAGEQAARMNAMDNATNNAGDMIDQLTLEYNRARQANITSELIEIISAMEAM